MKRRPIALWQSLICLLLCVSMLAGTTFAWFTDRVTTGVNTIAAGNLDVELYHSNATVQNEQVKTDTILFKDLNGNPILWEPGVVSYENLRVTNEGDLALQYRLAMETANENFVVYPDGTLCGLSQILKVGVVEGGITATDRADVVAAVDAANWTSLANFLRTGNLLPAGKGESEKTWGVVVYWQPGDNDNLWNLNNGKQLDTGSVLSIDLGVKLVATQLTDESDSFGPDYDQNATFPGVTGGSVSTQVPVENNIVTADTTLQGNGFKAFVPAGTKLADGATQLTFSVFEKDSSEANLTLDDQEEMYPLDVHIEGTAPDNDKPILVTIEKAMTIGLNIGNYKLYHVENGVANQMTAVAPAELDAHNEFTYDPATGDITLAMQTFSEVTMTANTQNPWNGYDKVDHSWYNADAKTLTIANADQLFSFSQIVGGIAKIEGEKVEDDFEGQTINLISDINLDDGEGDNDPNKIFYPIGYCNNDEEDTYKKNNKAVNSSLKNFKGTFDGQGHTVSNFYHNTWEMKGDNEYYAATDQHYRDGMGLFGRVYGGTIKNLTVDNFKSDGEYTTTGVIAAYADFGATFENISIFNCNPRVYNIGNGGIVGCVGWYTKGETDKKVTFKNITVDNSNKISALWGSYDVACGGIVGQYYPTSGQTSAGKPANAGIDLINCHVSAQMDVYNDVCGNYQYYAYRYAGMLIGSIRENLPADANGHIYPNMDKISASGCTVHFGDWNDYYYCELAVNGKASYTHDHKFSRLEQIADINTETKQYLPLGEEAEWEDIPSGRVNYVIVNAKDSGGKFIHGDGTAYATCYHFVDGKVWNHTDAGKQDGIDENKDGIIDWKEDKILVYREFNQLFTGYGWGVTSKGLTDFVGVENMDITTGHEDSVVKFGGKGVTELANGTPITIGSLFSFLDNGVKPVPGALTVSVNNLDEGNPVSATFVRDAENWENGTLTLAGTGKVQITIQDYYFCTPTTIEVTITDRQPVEKFETKFTGDFLYRVGSNKGSDDKGNIVKLDSLFKAKVGVPIGSNVSVDVETLNGTGASAAYTQNATWTEGTIAFSGTGIVKVTITDNDYCTPTELILEVVDAVNATTATSATAYNVVLLNHIDDAKSLSIKNGFTFYGNGFKVKYTGDGSYSSASVSYGFVTIEQGALDNVQIICRIFPKAYMFTNEMSVSNGRYPYGYSAVVVSGNSTISNSYIYGARNNIQVGGGNITIKNTVTECGSLSNIHIKSTSGNTVVLEDVTTIQRKVKDDFNVGNTMLGFAVLVGDNETTTYPTIKLVGDLKQYNWVSKADAEDVTNTYAKQAINSAVTKTNYVHTLDGAKKINLGIVFLTTNTTDIQDQDNRPNSVKTQVPYSLENVTISTYTGQVYSVKAGSQVKEASRYDATIDGVLPYAPSTQKAIAPEVAHSGVNGSSLKIDTAFNKDWITTFTADLDHITGGSYNFSFNDLVVKKFGKNLSFTVKDANGNSVDKAAVITLNQLDTREYTLIVDDYLIYNGNGQLSGKTVTHEMPFVLYATKTSIDPPKFTGIGSGVDSAIRLASSKGGNWRPAYPALEGVSVTYWSASQGKMATIDLATLTTKGAISGQTWTYSCEDFTLKITGGPVHSTTSYVLSPKVATRDGKDILYFAAFNKDNTTGTSARLICLEYVFTDKNASTTVGQCTSYSNGIATVNYSNLPEFSWSSFQNGKVEELGSSSTCVTADTLLTLADGTQKRIDELTYDDELLVWDFYNGEYTSAPISIIYAHEEMVQPVLHLNFSDGTTVKVISSHGFFDTAVNNFVYISESNVAEFIGHKFVKANGTNYAEVTLRSYEVVQEKTTAYWVQTAVHNNAVTEGILSITTPDYEGWFDYFNINDDMKYDEKHMQEEIAKYGLTSYDELSYLGSYETYIALNAQYLNILIGRGVVTMEEILELFELYA